MSAPTVRIPERGRDPHGVDRERFVAVYREWWPHMVRFIASKVRRGDRDIVEDLVQTTFLRALPYLDSFEVTEGGSLRGWLCTIARRVVCDHYTSAPGRRGAGEIPVPHDSLLWGSARVPVAAPADADPGGLPVEVQEALDQLPVETRLMVELYVMHGVPGPVVGRHLRRGKTRVYRLAREGIAELRVALGAPIAGPAVDDDSHRVCAGVQQ